MRSRSHCARYWEDGGVRRAAGEKGFIVVGSGAEKSIDVARREDLYRICASPFLSPNLNSEIIQDLDLAVNKGWPEGFQKKRDNHGSSKRVWGSE